jgi:uncharacterized integral membrane protein
MGETTRTRSSIPPSQVARMAVIAVVALVVLAFAIDNAQDVEVGWLVGSGQVALWIVIVLSALAGALIGYVAAMRRGR